MKNKNLRRLPAMLLALAVVFSLSVFSVPSASAVSVNGYTVEAMFGHDGSNNYTKFTTTLNSGYMSTWRDSHDSVPVPYWYGIRITLPARSTPSFLSVSGFYPVSEYMSSIYTTNQWIYQQYPSGGSSYINIGFFDSYVISSNPSPASHIRFDDYENYDGSPIYVPAHSGTCYVYLYQFSRTSVSNAYAMGVYRSSTSSIYLSDAAFALDATLRSTNSLLTQVKNNLSDPNSGGVLSVLNDIKSALSSGSSQPSPGDIMGKWEDDYITNNQPSLGKTEDYLGPSSPVLPNNFVSSSGGGSSFVDSVTENIGLSGNALDMNDFAQASGAFGGSASTDDGGMWQFFTQEVADAMTTGSGASAISDSLPPDDDESALSKWLEDSERWLSKW